MKQLNLPQVIIEFLKKIGKDNVLLGFIVYFSLCALSTSAQETQWASKVEEVSSEKVNFQFPTHNKAIQILGRPNSVPPKNSQIGLAWMPNGANFEKDFIRVGFAKPMYVQQIIIAENYNPGAVSHIYLYDTQGVEHLVHTNTLPAPKTGRLWHVKIPQTDYLVKSAKIIVSHATVKGYKQIDAIAICDHQEQLAQIIHLVKEFPTNIKKENLGKNVNSKFGEVAPIISPDGKTLFFTRINHPENIENPAKQDIWSAKQVKDNEWLLAENVGKPVNTGDDNAAAAISADGKTLYVLNVYKPDGSLELGLSKTHKQRLTWTFPEKVEIEDYYSESNYTEFAFSPNGHFLLLALKRKEGHGAKDLYVSRLKRDGTFSAPINLGNKVNTAMDEGSPFLAADNRTLFFTSDGHAGYGSGDIFLTRRLDETWANWSEPENLGPAINTPRWDGYFTIPASGDFAYMSSEEESFGKEDIFRIRLFDSIKPDPVVLMHGSVFRAGTFDKIPATVRVVPLSDTTSLSYQAKFDPETGDYKLIMPVGKSYRLVVEADGYHTKSELFDTEEDKTYRDVARNFQLNPLQIDQKIILESVYFDQSEYVLKEESFAELNRIINLLQNNPTMEILLEGHTDNQGDMLLNTKLAKNRVEAVKTYICEKGEIAATRVHIKSWGPARPIYSNASEESRKKNRRVEFSIVKM